MIPTKAKRGVTLIEVAVSTVLVGVVLVASLETLGGSMRVLRATSEPIDARSLLAQMVAEMLSVPYEDPEGNTAGIDIEADEPTAPTDRLAFDDLDDFDDFVVTPPQYADGTNVPGFAGWTQQFYVSYRDADVLNGQPVRIYDDEGVKRYQVKLISPGGTEYQLSGFRTPYGPIDEPAPFDAERVQAVLVDIGVGSANPISTGTCVDNLAEAP